MLFSKKSLVVLAVAVLGQCEAASLRISSPRNLQDEEERKEHEDSHHHDHDTTDLTVVDSVPQQALDYDGDDTDNEDVVVVIDGNKSTDAESESEYGFDCQTIHDMICNEDIFSTLCTLMYDTVPEVGKALDSGEWTFFAPKDSAFESIADIIDDLSEKELIRIFEFHALQGQTLWPWNLECTEKLEMYSGDLSRTRCEKNKETGEVVKFQKGNGNYNMGLIPQIEYPSLRTCNGIVHVIDLVMIPAGGKTATAITDAEVGAALVDEEEEDAATLVPTDSNSTSTD